MQAVKLSVRPSKLAEALGIILTAGSVPMITSSPGMGKSSIVHAVAKAANLKLIDHRLSTSEPTDLTGLPAFENGYAVFKPFRDLFPLDDQPLPVDASGAEMAGWLLFLDEFNSAHIDVQKAAYKLILDRMIGQEKLHPNVYIICAGNKTSDRAIVSQLSTAMQSRLVHIEMSPSFEDWLDAVAIPGNYDPRVIAYLSANPSKFNDFDPEHSDKTFCCARTWSAVNALIQGQSLSDEDHVAKLMAPILTGAITSGVAMDFIQFCRVFDSLVSVADIIRDPDNCKIPETTAAQWATVAMMAQAIEKTNVVALGTYANRLSTSFTVLFYRTAQVKVPSIKHEQVYISRMGAMARYLFT